MPTYDIPSFQDFVDGESSTVRSKLNDNFDNAEAQLQGVEDRLEESLTALHIDGVIWKRPGDVADLLVSAGAGLSVNVSAGEALIGFKFQVSGFTNDAGNGITNGTVNYCFLKQDGTLWFNTTGTPPTDQRNILLAKVTTAGGVVTAVDNYADGVVRGVGQPSLRSFTCTATEQVRDAVYVSAANTVAQAESDDTNPGKARVVGVILAKETSVSCLVATDGAVVGGYVGLTAGSAYYLQTVAGTLGTGKPTAPDPIVPVGIAVSTTAMLVKIFVDEAVITGTGGGDLPSLSDVDDALAYTAGFVLRADGAEYTGQPLAHADLSDDNELVHTTGAESVAGLKTFSTLPQSSAVPGTGNDLVNKTYVDAFSQGLTPKEACRVATTAAGTLASDFENGDTIDGVALATGDRILIKNQAAGETNGIYTVNASGAPTRATDYDASAEVQEGTFCYIAEGTANGGKEFVQVTVDPVLDTNSLVFVWLSNPNTYTASTGVKLVGQDFQVDLSDTNPSLEVTDGGVRAKVDDVTIQRDAGGLEVKAIDGSLLTNLPAVVAGANKLPTANLGSGTPDASTFLRGDQAWATPLGVGAGVVDINYTKSLATNTTETEIVNSSAEETLYTYTVPGGTLGANKTLRAIIQGTYKNNAGGSRSFTIRLKYGGTQITSKNSGGFAANAAMGNFCFVFLLSAAGVTSGQQGYMQCSAESGANVPIFWTDQGSSSIDSTVDQTLLITAQHSAAHAQLSIKTELVTIELLNAQDSVGAPIDASYVLLSPIASLTAERVLTGTAKQVVITDNGPGAEAVLSTPQDLDTDSVPTFGGLTIVDYSLPGADGAAAQVLTTDGVGTVTWETPAAAGEANTSSNVGTGEGQLAKAKVGVDLPFKTIKQATGITVTNNADDVTLTPSLPYIRNEIIVVVAGALTASTTVPKVGYMKSPAALTIEEVVCEVDTAPTGASLIVDIHKIPAADIETDFTGTTIYTTQANRPTLAISDRHVVATLPDVTAIAQGDVLRVYVDQIGSTIAGSDLTVCLRVKQQAAWA